MCYRTRPSITFLTLPLCYTVCHHKHTLLHLLGLRKSDASRIIIKPHLFTTRPQSEHVKAYGLPLSLSLQELPQKTVCTEHTQLAAKWLKTSTWKRLIKFSTVSNRREIGRYLIKHCGQQHTLSIIAWHVLLIYIVCFPTKNVLCQHTAYIKGRTGTFSGAASALTNNYNILEVVGYQTCFIEKDKNVVLHTMRRNCNLIMRLNSQNNVAKYEIHVGGNWRGIKYGTFCLNKQDSFSRHLFNIQSTFTEGSNDTVKNRRIGQNI